MRHYTEHDLEHYEALVDKAHARVVRQQVLIEGLTNFDRFDAACWLLDELTETLALYEQERIRILLALTK